MRPCRILIRSNLPDMITPFPCNSVVDASMTESRVVRPNMVVPPPDRDARELSGTVAVTISMSMSHTTFIDLQ